MPRTISPIRDSNRYDVVLQIAASAVGVLILLALAALGGIGQITLPRAEVNQNSLQQLEDAHRSAIELERNVVYLDQQIENIGKEIEVRKQDREMLATLLVAGEKKLAEKRALLSQQSQQDFDLARQIAVAKAELERLEAERLQVDEQAPKSLKVESYPTPLSRTVDTKELHIQLLGGRVTVLPVDELVERLKNSFKDRMWKLRDSTEVTDTVGPIDGFRMRYTLIRLDLMGQAAIEAGRGGSYVTLDHWELVPVASDLGEPWQEALGPTSLLRAKLDATHPRTWTITLWVYPDSFDAFRALRKEFYELGYSVAGRPLPDGMPIGGSPRGTKSSAQ